MEIQRPKHRAEVVDSPVQRTLSFGNIAIQDLVNNPERYGVVLRQLTDEEMDDETVEFFVPRPSRRS